MCYRAQEIEMEKSANFLKSVIAPGASSGSAVVPTVSVVFGTDLHAVLHSLQGAAMELYRKQHASSSSKKKKKKKEEEEPDERTATAAAQDEALGGSALGSVT